MEAESSAFVFVLSSHQLRIALEHSVFATRTTRFESLCREIVPTTCARSTPIYTYNRNTRELTGPYHATNFPQQDLLPLPVCGKKNRAHVPFVGGTHVFSIFVHVPMIYGVASRTHIDELFRLASLRLPSIMRPESVDSGIPEWLRRSKSVMDFWDDTVAAAALPSIASR